MFYEVDYKYYIKYSSSDSVAQVYWDVPYYNRHWPEINSTRSYPQPDWDTYIISSEGDI